MFCAQGGWLNFTTGLPTAADWSGAEWILGDNSTGHPDAASQLRTTFSLPREATEGLQAAQLFVASQGYFKCWINGAAVSDHEQGHATTFEARTLYDRFLDHYGGDKLRV